MKLTPGLLRSFVGGQFAVDDQSKQRIVQGEIQHALLGMRQGISFLLIIPLWLAQSDHYPARETGWRALVPTPYIASLAYYTVSDGGDGRIKLTSSLTKEVTTLYPRGSGTLQREDVGGL